MAIPLNRDFPFFKKLGQLCCIYGQLSKSMKNLKSNYPVLGAIPLPIWSLTCHYHMFVYPPVPTHMHQSVRTDCINIFVSSVKICECFPKMKVQSSKFNQWIQWFHKNIWFKERSKIANQNPQALKVKKSHVSQNFMHQHKVMHSFPSGKVKIAKYLKHISCIHRCIQSKGKS